jgi:hypothetical protein
MLPVVEEIYNSADSFDLLLKQARSAFASVH